MHLLRHLAQGAHDGGHSFPLRSPDQPEAVRPVRQIGSPGASFRSSNQCVAGFQVGKGRSTEPAGGIPHRPDRAILIAQGIGIDPATTYLPRKLLSFPTDYGGISETGGSYVPTTHTVDLTDRQTALVEELVRSGRYQSANDVLRDGLRSLHVARRGRRGRHFIMYRASADDTIEVVRILHDGMDLAAHVPPHAG